MNSLEIKTKIEINSNIENVWKTFIDKDKYSEWNPFINKIIGNLALNEIIFEYAYVNDFLNLPFLMKIVLFQPNHQLIYESSNDFFSRQIFYSCHQYKVEEINSKQTRFTHTAYFEGAFLIFQKEHLLSKVKDVHDKMNLALKNRVENIILSYGNTNQ